MTTTDETDEGPGDLWSRTTAPQSAFTSRQVAIGLLVLVAGSIVAFGLPLVLA